jgi:hypothetical protein
VPVSTHESITSTHILREAATWVAEATLLLRRSGVTGADDIAQTLAASVPKIEGLSANSYGGAQLTRNTRATHRGTILAQVSSPSASVAKPPCVGAAPRSAPAAGTLPLFAGKADHA